MWIGSLAQPDRSSASAAPLADDSTWMFMTASP
jgi:hypothetical protein